MTNVTLSLVGNPNCGKSTVFNALTHAAQPVGNWSGVTVACQKGTLSFQNQTMTLVDLPGIYQFSTQASDQGVDERLACDHLLAQSSDILINVVDAAHLERHLYLTLQLLAMDIPVIVAVNMMDVAKRRKIELDLNALEKQLGCPVVGLVANKQVGIAELKKTIYLVAQGERSCRKNPVSYPLPIQRTLDCLSQEIILESPRLRFCAPWLAQQLLQNSEFSDHALSPAMKTRVSDLRDSLEKELDEACDLVFADILYTQAHYLVQQCAPQPTTHITLTERIDKIVLNQFLGIPIFLGVIYLMFLFAINFAGAFQDFFDISSHAIFVEGTTQLLTSLHAPVWLVALLASGVGRGINTTITFLPVIGAMFFFLVFLESSGYMARASFVVDRVMRLLGLPGKSFVPMIIGFGCNVPAILAARTLEDPRDRVLTILMSPFMSCGARLAIFAVFASAFFPNGGQNVVFLLYLIGIMVAILTGFVLRKTVLQGEVTPLILELPPYHLPAFSALCQQMWRRLKSFIVNAGRLIIPICMLVGGLNAINVDGSLNQKASSAHSVLSSVGILVTPIFAPMGIQEANWPATVGLVSGVLAKEVVIGTLNTLYTQDDLRQVTPASSPSMGMELQAAFLSITSNLRGLTDSFRNPLVSAASEVSMPRNVYGVMVERFTSQSAAFAYLLFVLLYFPCVSATAVMAKELSKAWSLFSVLWSTGLAYLVATSFYQLATFSKHPLFSMGWLGIMAGLFLLSLLVMQYLGKKPRWRRLNPCQEVGS